MASGNFAEGRELRAVLFALRERAVSDARYATRARAAREQRPVRGARTRAGVQVGWGNVGGEGGGCVGVREDFDCGLRVFDEIVLFFEILMVECMIIGQRFLETIVFVKIFHCN